MKYGNMGIKRSVLIRQTDLWDLESFDSDRTTEKIQKLKWQHFLCILRQNPL